MQFNNIIGQQATKFQLVNMAQQNRLSHALLFLSKEGSGALQLAIAFAQFIVCEKNSPFAQPIKAHTVDLFATSTSLFGNDEPTPIIEEIIDATLKNDSCGTCAACLKAQQLIHPDIHFTYPVLPSKAGDKPISTNYIKEWREFISINPYGNVFDWLQFIGAENKQGNITAEECNDINRKISLKSFESTFKILIIWMPEYLTKNGNKLLKLIEEPPPNTLFLFVAENEALILPTILSRTQLISIHALSNAEIATALQQKNEISADKALQIAAVSQGNYREAQHVLQHDEDDWLQILREWLNMIVKRNVASQLKWIEDMSKQGREKQKQFLKYFTHLLEQAVKLGATANNEQQIFTMAQADADFAQKLNKMCSIYQQEAIMHELDKASYYIERNANGKILFHALTIKLYHIISNNSLILIR
jgi:DNA polymerase III subunit delta'